MTTVVCANQEPAFRLGPITTIISSCLGWVRDSINFFCFIRGAAARYGPASRGACGSALRRLAAKSRERRDDGRGRRDAQGW